MEFSAIEYDRMVETLNSLEHAIASAAHSPRSIEFRPATIRSVVNDK